MTETTSAPETTQWRGDEPLARAELDQEFEARIRQLELSNTVLRRRLLVASCTAVVTLVALLTSVLWSGITTLRESNRSTAATMEAIDDLQKRIGVLSENFQATSDVHTSQSGMLNRQIDDLRNQLAVAPPTGTSIDSATDTLEQAGESKTATAESGAAPGKPAPAAPANAGERDHNALSRRATIGELSPDPEVVLQPSIEAFILDLKTLERSGRWYSEFDLVLNNRNTLRHELYAVVYARNDAISPPRRVAWPRPDVIFEESRTKRGFLGSGTFRRNWQGRPEESRGLRITLNPDASRTLKVVLPLAAVSPHKAWEGEPLDPVGFREYYLWVFDTTGVLVFSKRYETEPPELE